MGGLLEKGSGEDTQPGADFEDTVVGIERGFAKQVSENITIHQEALAENTTGLERRLSEERGDIGGASGIHEAGAREALRKFSRSAFS